MERLLYPKAPENSINKAIEAIKKMYQATVENLDQGIPSHKTGKRPLIISGKRDSNRSGVVHLLRDQFPATCGCEIHYPITEHFQILSLSQCEFIMERGINRHNQQIHIKIRLIYLYTPTCLILDRSLCAFSKLQATIICYILVYYKITY